MPDESHEKVEQGGGDVADASSAQAEPGSPSRVADDEANDRRAAPVRALVAAILLLTAAALVARLMMNFAEDRARGLPDDFGSGAKRLAKFVELLPQIANRPGPSAIVLGSSLAYFGVALDTFDGRMRELGVPMTTYTAATPLVPPSIQIVLARHVERAFAPERGRLALMLLEFTPHGMTRASAAAGGAFQRATLRDLAAVADVQSVAELALRSPDDAAHVVGLAALGDADSQTVDAVLARYLLTPASERDRRGPQVMLEAALANAFGEGARAWNPRSRGEPRWLLPSSQVPYLQVVRGFQASKRRHQARLVEANDALELHIDEPRLEEFVALVRQCQQIAQHTIVWLAPRNTDFIAPTPEGLARLADALARVERETNVPIVDLTSEPDIAPEDFLDATHVTEHAGRPKLSRALAEGVARVIKEEEGAAPPP